MTDSPSPAIGPNTCQTCHAGVMQRRKKYVFGAGGAIFRFLLLIGGIILFLLGSVGLLTTSNSGDTGEALSQLRARYETRGLATSMVEDVMADGVYNGNKSHLDMHTRGVIDQFEADYAKATTTSALGGALSFLAGGLSKFALIAGLICIALGFLAGLRRWKLVCNECGDTIAAA